MLLRVGYIEYSKDGSKDGITRHFTRTKTEEDLYEGDFS